MQLLFTKAGNGLIPATEEASEWLQKKRLGATILVETREPRNGAWFRKWWALIELGYSYFRDSVQPMEYKGHPVLPDLTRFRKDVTILCGHYHAVTNLKGEIRIEADSLSWASMDETTFEKLYSATIQVLLAKVFNGQVCRQWTEEELRNVADQILSFAA